MKCPGFDQLIDYCEGLLTSRDAQLVAAHLETGCEKCAVNRQWYERVRAIAARDDTVAPPPWVLMRALKLFGRERAQDEAVDSFGRTVALLIFDSLSQPALAEVRSAEVSNRQLLYRAGQYSIDLQIALDRSIGELTGQVLRESESGFDSVTELPVDLFSGGEKLHSTVTNEVGKFTIKTVSVGEYDLLIETRVGLITVPQLQVKSFDPREQRSFEGEEID